MNSITLRELQPSVSVVAYMPQADKNTNLQVYLQLHLVGLHYLVLSVGMSYE